MAHYSGVDASAAYRPREKGKGRAGKTGDDDVAGTYIAECLSRRPTAAAEKKRTDIKERASNA